MDPQKAPLPQFTKAPSRHEELFFAVCRFLLVLTRFAVKLVFVGVTFIVAFIGAISWRK
jgi:hypothetical protein